ncbi:UNVERIFIED_ORG: hypothetical protein MaF1660_ph0093 [Mycobacterium phage Adler]
MATGGKSTSKQPRCRRESGRTEAIRLATSVWVCTTVCGAAANFPCTVDWSRFGIAAIASRSTACTDMGLSIPVATDRPGEVAAVRGPFAGTRAPLH